MKNKKHIIIWSAFVLAVALIIIGFFYLERNERIEVAGALFVAFFASDGLDVIRVRRKEKNPLV
jgi:hypothetical protein